MAKTIVLNAAPEELRMAIIEDGELSEVAIERSESGHIVGNIYKGKINNVLPGMQAAFIDIGREKNAFLYIGDILPDSGRLSTDEMLSSGQDIMIQIVKDALGTKGPRATTQLTLPGRYVVLMPTVDYIGISRRIKSEAERERLKSLAEMVKPPGMGLIVRTVAEGKSAEDLHKDIGYLCNLWKALAARGKRANAPALLYRDVDLVIRIVRDYLSDDVTEFVLDSKEAYMRVCDLLKFAAPEMVERVRLHDKNDSIFACYGIEKELNKLGQRQVELKCGGYIVIDYTEALTVIDVNTGKFVGATNLSDTVFHTNLEAAAEIARQIRLRDIGGIIIIDFIDMDTEEHKKAILDAFEEKLQKDRTKTNVYGLTGLGLVEMTRKKVRQNLDAMMYGECPFCQGRGRMQTPETVAIQVRRHLRELCRNKKSRSLTVQVHPRVAEVLDKMPDLELLERELSCSLKIEALQTLHPEAFSVLGSKE